MKFFNSLVGGILMADDAVHNTKSLNILVNAVVNASGDFALHKVRVLL
jgi:hypothetical protein